MELRPETVLDLAAEFKALAARLEALVGEPVTPAAVDADLTVADLCAHFQRSASTVRGWLEAGRFPGAYKLPGSPKHSAWRIPPAALTAFKASTAPLNIDAYRRHLRRKPA